MAYEGETLSAARACGADYEFFTDGTDAIVIALTVKETINLYFNLDAAGEVDDLEVIVYGLQLISTGNGLDGATADDDLELDTAADGQALDDFHIGWIIIMTSGDEQGEGRLIVDSVAADDGVNLSHSLSGQPSAAETYDLYRAIVLSSFQITAETAPTSDLPQHGGVKITGHPLIAVAARATGGTDAHIAWMSYEGDGVDV